MRVHYLIIALVVLAGCAYLALGGCCTTGKAVACPPLKVYTAAEEKALADAMGAAGPQRRHRARPGRF